MRKLAEVLQDWEAVIGLEVHTELTTLKTKMFCGCELSHDDPPNSHVCPVCLGMPGALPVPNREAVRSIVKAGLACGCQIMERSMFYRKHYFYPDMAKNFQTTQGPVAFCMHGQLTLEVGAEGAKELPAAGLEGPRRALAGGYEADVRILRIHLEEDAAKMIHVGGEEGRIASATESLIDYNRCGTPLIELVTEPDLRTPEEARLFMEKLRRVFLTLGISDCSLENGSMRCDGNVSLRRRGSQELGTKTELKNINSFKSLHDGLEYEIRRQADVLESGGEVFQETRHWEPGKKRTVVMRVKETADDYRLFPDPDLAPFDLSREFVESCRAELPELPDAKRDRYVQNWGIKRADAALIASDPACALFFEQAVDAAATLPQPKAAATLANLVVNELAAELKTRGLGFEASPVTPQALAVLAGLLAKGEVSSTAGREVLAAVAETGEDPEAVVEKRGLRQVTDDGALAPIVTEVLAACPDQVAQYQGGNTKVVGYLVGQCMKRAKGQGNPKRFNELLVEAMTAAPAEKPTAKAEPKPAVKAEEKPTAKPEPKPAAAAKTAAKPAAKAEPKPAAKPAAKAPATARAAKSEPKPAAKPEEKPAAAKTAAKPESKPAAEKPATKPEPKVAPAAKAAPKPVAKKASAAERPAAKAPAKAEPKPVAKAEEKTAAKVATKPEPKVAPAAKAAPKPVAKKAAAAEEPVAKSEPKLAVKAEAKAASAEKPVAKAEPKPAAEPAAAAAPKAVPAVVEKPAEPATAEKAPAPKKASAAGRAATAAKKSAGATARKRRKKR